MRILDLSDALRGRLLWLARRAIERELRAGPPDEDPGLPELQTPQGAFVTLKHRHDGALRGCVGIPQPLYPLATAVTRAAVGAAFHDTRFPPVVLSELAVLSVQVSVLSPLAPIVAEAVTVGVHGLVVRQGPFSGLLLPQVAVSEGWDREAFLVHTCIKAGLSREAWRDRECEILAFTAVVFGEAPDGPAPPPGSVSGQNQAG